MTALITAESDHDDYGALARHGVEEFVADNVIILRNVLEDEKRRRTIEILKFRGTDHQKGEFPFTIVARRGRRRRSRSRRSSSTRSRPTSGSRSGNAELDEMCGGGFFRDSVILVSGATGTGKTLIVTAVHGRRRRARASAACCFAFEESREQLFRNAARLGRRLRAAWSATACCKVVCDYPEVADPRGPPDRDQARRSTEFKPHRVAVDSLSALERVGSTQGASASSSSG